MDVWAQPGVFEKLFPSVFRNSPRFWAQPGFSEELFPLACRRLGTDAIFAKTDPNLAGNQGEQLNENSRLCPILAGCLRIHGIRNSIFLSCAQMPEIHGEHFRKICSCAQILSIVCECTTDRMVLCPDASYLPVNSQLTGCSCAQLSSQRDLHASAKSGACRTSAGFFLSLSATAPFLVYNCGSG